jgi:hypothetical protein
LPTVTEAPGVPPIEGVDEVEPVDPEPEEPEPEEPEPEEPDPLEPEVPEPEPVVVEPEPVDPEPVEPEPVDPEPVDPEPVEPEPVEPEPVEPEPVDPEPVEPDPLEPEVPEVVEVDEVVEVPELPLELLLQPAMAVASTVHIRIPVPFFSHHVLRPVICLLNSIRRSCSLHAPAQPASHATLSCTHQQHQPRSYFERRNYRVNA